jgi:hypothetical protein
LADLDPQIEDLEREAAELTNTFIASDGIEREFPEGLPVEEREKYVADLEVAIEANRDNHAKPIALMADLPDSHFGR